MTWPRAWPRREGHFLLDQSVRLLHCIQVEQGKKLSRRSLKSRLKFSFKTMSTYSLLRKILCRQPVLPSCIMRSRSILENLTRVFKFTHQFCEFSETIRDVNYHCVRRAHNS